MQRIVDEFKTIERVVRAETRVQGSRFIAVATPVTDRASADQAVAAMKAEFHDATHHCFAFRLGTNGNAFRYSDAGEPSGTAGRPILQGIDKFGVTDVCVIVTRYFGGTKLGVGGLMRAYGEAADEVLSAAHTVTRFKTCLLEASFPHTHISNVMHVVSKAAARIVETTYDEEVHLQLEIRSSRVEELKALLMDRTKGNIRVRLIAGDGGHQV